MQCPFCYAWIAVDADVCPRCERRLSPAAPGPPSATPDSAAADGALRESLMPEFDSAGPTAQRAAWLPVAGLSAVLVVALALIVWLSWPRPDEHTDAGAGRATETTARPPATISYLPRAPSESPTTPRSDRAPEPGPAEAVEATYETVLPDPAYDPYRSDGWAQDNAVSADELASLRFQQFRLEESHRESQASLRRLYAEAERRHAAELADLEQRSEASADAYEARIAELRSEQERMAQGYGKSLAEIDERQSALQARQRREAEDLQKRIATEKALREAMEQEWERERAGLLQSQADLERQYEGQIDQLRRRQSRLETRVSGAESEADTD